MSVTAPAGFAAGAVAAGLKPSGAPDLALVRNLGPRFDAAAVFTSNRVTAAPVRWSRQVIADQTLQAVILNSGGANACTGVDGLNDAQHGADRVAEQLGIAAADVAVCSTGLIGEQLPMDRYHAAVPALVAEASTDGGTGAATAILTTDTHTKQATSTVGDATIGGMAKGAGMLAPGLATMLVVITTDAVIDGPDLDTALRHATRHTFDRLDSDGCMSTNDTVIALSSGAFGSRPSCDDFTAALTRVCDDLAQQMLADAEGAKHQIAVTVAGAATESDAITVGRAIARNNLVKCAVFGQDPNWGRVLAAIGTTDACFDPDALDVAFNGIGVCQGGAIGQPRELVDLTSPQVSIDVDLHAGTQTATIWTNDLTYDYVTENAEYSS
jgi:glutamate N-acetyltransferase/amino-acid N-acetyltransferase